MQNLAQHGKDICFPKEKGIFLSPLNKVISIQECISISHETLPCLHHFRGMEKEKQKKLHTLIMLARKAVRLYYAQATPQE